METTEHTEVVVNINDDIVDVQMSQSTSKTNKMTFALSEA